MPITRLSVDGYGSRRAGSFAGRAEVVAIVAATGGGIGHGGTKKKKYENKKVWLVKVDETDYEVVDLEEIKPIVSAIMAKGKSPKVKAKPMVETPRLAAEIYAEQYFLTQYVPMPVYDKRLNFVNILPYILAMQEIEDEEELLLLAA